ncbi:MAG: hypothetical protein Q8P83_03390 [bacterium]|nr:hypothetical protein [bacterium]
MNGQNNFWKLGTKLGLFFAIIFSVCFIWFFLRGGNEEIRQLHDNLFALTFFGWSGMNGASFILGLIQSFVWGYISMALWYVAGVFSNK